ncbi:hypothetical protein PACTADRAFT_4814 [Pachysolen tannophilus NRRL Y-2460]|uniref:RNA polymerase I-specific transcription initiation factor RRN6 n=1 Tax=Pachysolen tannophilus NRRL Y-2460 TaxID=669874 RepID=A0A1E4TQ92_PACTA|nr:hypothetical protein PACTADRAFT_4814 [Pachysolen tannophilus NRRL Y-2460]
MSSWPSKKGLGVQLSYGVDGSALYLPRVNQEYPFIFAKERNLGVNLHKVEYSTEKLNIDTKLHNNYDNVSGRNYGKNEEKIFGNEDELYISEELLKFFNKESSQFLSNLIYDPNIDGLMKISLVKIKKFDTSQAVIGYSSGITGNIANVSVLTNKKTKIVDKTTNKVYEILKPEFLKPFQIDVISTIKQIEFSRNYYEEELACPYMAIRTNDTVYILKIFLKNKKDEVNLELIGDLSSDSFHNEIFADLEFNPWDFTQFGIIDIRGNFGIYNIRERNLATLVKAKISDDETTTSIYNPEELSNFKKIKWSYDLNSIFLMDRSSIYSYNLKDFTMINLISANTWSKLLDFVNINDKLSILLTSKEIIVVDLSVLNKAQRLMSWKHFLNDKDPSLKISILQFNKQPDDFLVMIYSQTHSLVYCIKFGFRDGFIKCLNDPFPIILNNQDGSPLQSILTVPIDSVDDDIQFCALFEMSTDLEIFVSIYSTISNGSILSTNERIIEKEEEEIKRSISPITVEAGNVNNNSIVSGENSYLRISKTQLKALYSKLTENDDISRNSDDTTEEEEQQQEQDEEEGTSKIQKYAFNISSTLNNIIQSEDEETPFKTLFEISDEFPTNLRDFPELDSMIEQLIDHFKDLSFYNIDDLRIPNLISDVDGQYSIANIFNFLLKIWKGSSVDVSDSDLRKIGKISQFLGSSLVIFGKKSNDFLHQKQINTLSQKLPKELSRMVDDWGSEYTTDDLENSLDDNTQRSSIYTSSTLPSVKVAGRARTNTVGQKSSLIGGVYSQLASSQASDNDGSQRVVSTQIERGNFADRNKRTVLNKKKKKKKKGGFA